MCGIAGWIDWEEGRWEYREGVVREMTRTLANRGPDAEGFFVSGSAALGHRRLIVVDPEGGGQPMDSTWRGQRAVLVYNGELYNTEDIRAELKAEGHHFSGYSDTEVLLRAYMSWGEDCVRHLNGIFAFAIWDEARETLFCARDRMGVKPFFYAPVPGGWVFASEIKALLAHPDIVPRIKETGICELMGLSPARSPGCGVLEGIYELKPGHSLMITRKGQRDIPYWGLNCAAHPDGFDDTVAHVRWLIEDAVRRQLVSDVKVCSFLSGGLDSSVLAVLAVRHQPALDTYSIEYRENTEHFRADAFQPDADAEWVDRVSQYIGTRHRHIYVDTPMIMNALEDATIARDLPGMADIDSSLLLFCRQVKENATVALSGECADEVFAGYPWYYRKELWKNDSFPWAGDISLRERILAPRLRERLSLREYVEERYREAIAGAPLSDGLTEEERWHRQLFWLNLTWFMQVLLERKDRMSMACGLEVRVPYCDHRIVEYLYNVPASMLFHRGREKGLIRLALTGLLPEDVLWRKKSPYPKTHDPAYEEGTHRRLVSVLEDKTAPLHQLVDEDAVKVLMRDPKTLSKRPWFGQLMRRPQFFAWLLQLNDWLGRYHVRIEI